MAYLMAQAKKPHMIGETVMKLAAIAINWAMHWEKLARELASLLLSNGTIV